MKYHTEIELDHEDVLKAIKAYIRTSMNLGVRASEISVEIPARDAEGAVTWVPAVTRVNIKTGGAE